MTRHSTLRPLAPLGPAALVLLLSLPAAGTAAAQGVPADAIFRDFRPTGDYRLEVEGEAVPRAQIYFSERAGAILILTRRLPAPVLISPRGRSVETVDLMKVDKRPEGVVHLLADAVMRSQGGFRLVDGDVHFSVEGTRATLKRRPDVLGQLSLAGMREEKPDYHRRESLYEPSERAMATLRSEQRDVRVRIFFGTWCPFCTEVVPSVMRVADELEGSRVAVDFYGLPRDFSQDPITERLDLHSVPTGIVYVGGREVGRLTGAEVWHAPEEAIARILGG